MIMLKFDKSFYLKIIIYTILSAFIATGICYSQSNSLIRVPIRNYTRIENYITQTILPKQVFPSSLLRDVFSKTGLTVKFKNRQNASKSIDLSFPGINDGIKIKFVDRAELGSKPFTRTKSDVKITYAIAQDITFNETRYLLRDMDSILKRYGNRLRLSSTFSLRLRHLAIYFSNNINFGKLSNVKSIKLKREIENLYLLGLILDRRNIIMPDKPIAPLTFDDIRNKRYLYKTAILDYMKANNLFTNLTSGNTDEFIGNIRKIMIKEAIIAVKANFNSMILSKGVERLFTELGIVENLKDYLRTIQLAPLNNLLKDNLPLDDWKKRIKAAQTSSEELSVFKEIVQIVDKYPGWQDKRDIGFIIKYAISMQEMSCILRSILLSRILKEIGIGEDRLYKVGFPRHAFLIMRLKNGGYLEIQTTADAFNDTKILPKRMEAGLNDAVKKVELLGNVSLTLKEPLFGNFYPESKELLELELEEELLELEPEEELLGSVSLTPIESLFGNFYPESKVINISKITQGFIGDFYNNLSSQIGYLIIDDIQSSKPKFTEQQRIEMYGEVIMLLQEATDINPNFADAYIGWGSTLNNLARIVQDTDLQAAIKYLKEACEKYEKAANINPNFASTFKSWGIALENLALTVKDTDLQAAIKYLDGAIKKIETALSIVPNDSEAKEFLEVVRNKKKELEFISLSSSGHIRIKSSL